MKLIKVIMNKIEEANNFHKEHITCSIENHLDCPICGKKTVAYDSCNETFQCYFCKNILKEEGPTGRYVLVEFPEDTSFYEDNDIGYPCFNSEDNGARYVPESFYRQYTGHKPEMNNMFLPIQWPASQKYIFLQPESIAELCEPIEGDVKSIEAFGDMSIWVPLCLIENPENTEGSNVTL